MILALIALTLAAQDVRWYDAQHLGIEGQGWRDTKHPYDRLPAKAEGVVRPPVWSLSHDSAGMQVRFSTAAPSVRVRWTVRKQRLELPHMPATGVSGLDLYVLSAGKWHWLANGRPEKQSNEQALVRDWTGGRRDYLLYLPLYNGIEKLEIGVPAGNEIQPAAKATRRPVLFYGTSILQGGCASRPGMAYPAIVSRLVDWPAINLGFSGNAKSEPEMSKLMAELDPAAYVYDSLPNLSPEETAQRTKPFLEALRAAHPKTPIVLVENIIYTDSGFVESRRKQYTAKNATLRAVYEQLRKAGDKHLYYVPAKNLLDAEGEGTVDGTHPTDLGFDRMARAIAPVLAKALRQSR